MQYLNLHEDEIYRYRKLTTKVTEGFRSSATYIQCCDASSVPVSTEMVKEEGICEPLFSAKTR
jgi:hypothetical protein